MTEKELRKLKRSDFLQLLLAQGKDLTAVQARLDEKIEELELLRNSNEDLRSKLDRKNEQIDKLKGDLDSRDATISALRQEIEDMKAILSAIRLTDPDKDGSDATVPRSLNEIFEATREAKSGTAAANRRRSRNKR